MNVHRLGVVVIAATTAVASADPPPCATAVAPGATAVPQCPEPTSASVAGAPLPDQASGRLDPVDTGDSMGRIVIRDALYVPKLVFQLTMLPLKGGFYAYDRFELDRRYYETFYSPDRTMGVIPTATYETGYGITAGARFFDDNLLGKGEHTVFQGTIGTEYRVGVLGSVDSGVRLGPALRVEVGGNFDRRPQEPFYGIGNNGGQVIENPGPAPDLDALTNTIPVRAFMRYQEARAFLHSDWIVVPDIHVQALGSFTDLMYSPSKTDPSIQEVYNPSTLVGFDTGVEHLYGEVSVSWDTRHRRSVWEPLSVNSEGSLVLGFGGYNTQLQDLGSFAHYGVELQHYFRLGFGPRVLIARFHGEAVTGPLDIVPITQLPMLGGEAFLRGYPYARFRDRIAAVASLQYMWNLSQYAEAFLFVDVGRVYPDYSSLTVSDMRAGFGAGLEFHSLSGFLIDGFLASSSDGGVMVTAAFSPILDSRPRWR